jgi:hypothetical protein
MGLYDHISVSGPEFVCSEGHDLSGEGFQSKDFGCTMGHVAVSADGVTMESGGWGDDVSRPLLGRFYVYGPCTQCPAFVQAKTRNIVECSVEFEVDIVDDKVRSITRISPSTPEFLADTPRQEWMRGCTGPLPYEEAYALHIAGLSVPVRP